MYQKKTNRFNVINLIRRIRRIYSLFAPAVKVREPWPEHRGKVTRNPMPILHLSASSIYSTALAWRCICSSDDPGDKLQIIHAQASIPKTIKKNDTSINIIMKIRNQRLSEISLSIRMDTAAFLHIVRLVLSAHLRKHRRHSCLASPNAGVH